MNIISHCQYIYNHRFENIQHNVALKPFGKTANYPAAVLQWCRLNSHSEQKRQYIFSLIAIIFYFFHFL